MNRMVVLVAVAVVLAGMVAWEATSFGLIAPAPIPPRQAAVDPAGPTDARPPRTADWMATALERPLFRENRRPAIAVSDAVPPERAVRLAGVITGPFGKRAIFMSTGEGKPIVVSEGARVGDFVVRSIGDGQAVVEAEGGVRTLRLSFAGDRPSAPR